MQRDLGAEDVLLVDVDPTPELEADRIVEVALTRGFRLVATFAAPLADRDATLRRLQLIAESFRDTLDDAIADACRRPPAERLHEELSELAKAAGAADAVVIDARSPMVWGAAEGEHVTPQLRQRQAEVIPLHRDRASTPPPAPKASTERAIDAVLALPATQALARGGHLSTHERNAPAPYSARSFAGIYVVILVYTGPFDELRSERTLNARLHVIEQLVLALPPITPEPGGGARAIRRRQ